MPEVGGALFDEVIDAGEHIVGMVALWDEGNAQERHEMVTLMVKPGGLYYDLENKIMAAIKPQPAFLPLLRMLNGVVEYYEAKGLLVTEHWSLRNRRVSVTLSPTLTLFLKPHGILYLKLQQVLAQLQPNYSEPLPPAKRRRLSITKIKHSIPPIERPMVARRVLENQEPLRKVADDYGVSHETVRRTVRAVSKK